MMLARLVVLGLTCWSALAMAHPPHLADEVANPRDFVEGLDLFYAFNDAAAVEAFTRAAAANDNCAMCYWGIAEAHARAFLLTDDPADRLAGLAALDEANRALRARPATDLMLAHALIRVTQALLEPGHLAKLRTYAAGMKSVYNRWPDHPDVGALYGLALLGQSPSCHWMGPQTLSEDAPVLAVLEHVLSIDPGHIGAHHFYIHARERSAYPERALSSAHALPRLAGHLGHMVHMPSHIYLRVGDYEAAAQSNVDAIAVDAAWFAQTEARGVYYDLFYLHNHHFLWSAQMMLGAYNDALATARTLQRLMSDRMVKYPFAHELFAATEILTHIRFNEWEAAQAAEAPDGAGPYVLTLEQLAHGLAALAQGDGATAQHMLHNMEALSSELAVTGTQRVGMLARRLMAAELARFQGRWEEAARLYREGIVLEDNLPYAEPWLWQLPLRDFYGEALHARGDFAEVAVHCKAELQRHPHSPFAQRLCETTRAHL